MTYQYTRPLDTTPPAAHIRQLMDPWQLDLQAAFAFFTCFCNPSNDGGSVLHYEQTRMIEPQQIFYVMTLKKFSVTTQGEAQSQSFVVQPTSRKKHVDQIDPRFQKSPEAAAHHFVIPCESRQELLGTVLGIESANGFLVIRKISSRRIPEFSRCRPRDTDFE